MGRRVRVEADGGSRGNPGPAGYGAVVTDVETGEVLAEAAAGIGVATNNVAEYRGLIAGLEAAAELDPESVEVRMDSLLVVQQMAGRWKVKHPAMAALKAQADAVVGRLPRVRYAHIARELNGHADRLANEAMDAAARGEIWQRRVLAATPPDDPPTKRDPVAPPARKTTKGDPVASRSGSDVPDLPDAPAARPNRLSGWTAPSGPPCTTLLLRHGQTALSVERRFSGCGADPELTETGLAQAAAAARRIARDAAGRTITAVYSSPLRRAGQTATAVAHALGLLVRTEPRLAETDFGEWDGYTFAEIQAEWPADLAKWLADPAVAPPGGESFASTMVRVQEAREEIAEAHAGERVLLVTHVTPIKSLLREALDAGPGVLYRLHLDLASLCEIDWYADEAAVVRSMNDVSHLADLTPADRLF
ncbi:MAG TPA: bifunctional RNase H/acid phosphatase [Mycobacteriales bacterium]|nr:bifunctional RNase H/acid phosphatase [Mycobacteriales bacterium]